MGISEDENTTPAEEATKFQQAKQRFHDYFVLLYRSGKMTNEDMPQYQQAMAMERNKEVKSLPQ